MVAKSSSSAEFPRVSVIVPVFNEEENLPFLFQRLLDSCRAMEHSFELIFTNDGSSDNSLKILKDFHKELPDIVRVVDFGSNFGQHLAIIAAFSKAKGDIIVTLDADLQNPPEEIHKLIQKFDEGYDCVGSIRENRQDTFFRKSISRMINRIREKITHIKMEDQGCMLRAYSRDIVQKILDANEASTFIPAMAYHFANNPTDIVVAHNSRAFGESKYNLYSLMRLNFNLITGFSLVPLQMFTFFGMGAAFLSGILGIFIVARRFLFGAEVGGVFTLFAILFFLISVLIMGIGIIGEYVGRIFQHISTRPRYTIKTFHTNDQ